MNIRDIVMLFIDARFDSVEKLKTILLYIASKLPMNSKNRKIVKIKIKSGYSIFM
jgi:hypothetical protein